jgi:hypothetical protein
MSAFDILAMQDTPKWPSLDHAKPVWQRLKHVLFSKQVEVRLACLCRFSFLFFSFLFFSFLLI